jgi:hypothetical protein
MSVHSATIDDESATWQCVESQPETGEFDPDPGTFGPVVDAVSSGSQLFHTWLAGAVLSVIAIWAICLYTVDDPVPYVWDAEVGRTVNAPGTYLSANEGYAWTTFGRYGLAGLPDASQTVRAAGGNWVAVWGDSHVEAMQVDDDEKMAIVSNHLWAQHNDMPVAFVGIGMAGWTLADIYYNIPTYERILGEPRLHIIVLSETADLVPDRFEREAMFVSKPAFGFQPSHWRPAHSSLKQRMCDLRLGFAWELLRESSDFSLRWRPGPISGDSQPSIVADEFVDPAAVDFLLDSLQSQTACPLGFIVLSRAPGMTNGELKVMESFKKGNLVLNEACERRGMPYATMLESFVHFARTEKKFPRSFLTRYRGGHLNQYGHRLVAEKIIEMAKAKIVSTAESDHHAVHSN